MTRKLLRFLREHVVGAMLASGAAGGLVSAISTAAFSDFTNFRTTERALVQADYDKVRAVQIDMDSVLQKFADKASGKASTTSADIDALRKSVKDGYANAEQLSRRIPSIRREFDELADKLLALQKAAISFNGQIDAKYFVKSVDDYYVALNEFNEAAVNAQGKWLALN